MTFDRKTYAREYARRQRAKAIAQANLTRIRCIAWLARGVKCNWPLQSRLVDGETVAFCPRCDLKARGLCVECGAPVAGTLRRALYCAYHRKVVHHATLQRYRKANPAVERRAEKRRQRDAEKRAAKLAYKRLYRLANPEKIKRYKQEYAARHRDHILAYMRTYNATHTAPSLASGRTCLTCPTRVAGRVKRCAECKQRDRQQARAAILQRLERAA